MFCCLSCSTSAWERFHQHECSGLDQSLADGNEYDIMILKIIFESISIAGGSLDQLQRLLDDQKPNSTVFDFDLKNLKLNSQRDKNLLKAIYSLKKGPTSAEDLSMAEWLVDSHPDVKSICKTKAKKEFLQSFVTRMMGIIDRNSYILMCPSMRGVLVEEEIGSGVYPFSSLINHSCSPNLYRVFVDSKQVFIVKKPIEKGQQLFVGYQSVVNKLFVQFFFHYFYYFRSNFAVLPRSQRQEFLLNEFQFQCSCEACTANFPLLKDLPKCIENFIAPPTTAATFQGAVKVFEENCDFVKKNIKRFIFPCHEICYVMQNSFRQLQFIAGQIFSVQNEDKMN